jgi:hypothetical protein
MVHRGELDQHGGLELADLLGRQRLPAVYLIKNSVDLGLRIILGIELLDAVVRKAAADRPEELVTHAQRVDHIGELRDRDARNLRKLLHISAEIGRNLHGHRLVGTPRGEHPGRKTVLADLDVVFERIHGIVRRADRLDVVAAHQAAGVVFGTLQQRRAMVVDFAGRSGVEQFRHPEGGLQFEVGPVVERVAHRIGNRLGPLLELLPIGRILARAILLIDPVGAHGAPFVVVAFEPDLRQVVETVVRSHVLGNQVAMVVDDRHLGRMVVVKTLRSLGLQQEVVVVELFHKK